MSFGLWYAVFAEHQALDRIGSSLAASLVHAAERRVSDSQTALKQYSEAQYNYVRNVDVHGHWIGLAMLLVVLGIAFNRVSFAEPVRVWLALGIFLGAFLFPFGVFLQTLSHGLMPRACRLGNGVGFAKCDRSGSRAGPRSGSLTNNFKDVCAEQGS
jgi:hypothetical protein